MCIRSYLQQPIHLHIQLTVVVLLNSFGRLDMWQGHDRRGVLLGSSSRSISQSVRPSKFSSILYGVRAKRQRLGGKEASSPGFKVACLLHPVMPDIHGTHTHYQVASSSLDVSGYAVQSWIQTSQNIHLQCPYHGL
ncbi:hypothetical protein ABZX51_007625 [Aspergillus tubingensis]